MRYILALLALGIATALQASVPSGSIDDFITTEMPISGAPGLAYAVVEDGVIHADARGEMLIGSGRKVTPDTPFVLGSISKSFTAMAVMQLVEAGKVDLDTGISHYLDVFSGRPSGAITIRQLLSHTSGYSTLQGNQPPTDLTQSKDALSRQVKRIAQWTPAYEPGAKWEYSNANYQILGALIEAVSGLDYASYIETKILEPIGMEHSFVADGQSHDAMATGHRPWFGTKRPIEGSMTDRVTAPQGGVIASARDLARYLAIMMNGEDDIISAKGKGRHDAPRPARRRHFMASAGSSIPKKEPCSTLAPPQESKRSRPWFRQRRRVPSSWSMRGVELGLVKPWSSATASAPEHSAWITLAKGVAGNKRLCLSD